MAPPPMMVLLGLDLRKRMTMLYRRDDVCRYTRREYRRHTMGSKGLRRALRTIVPIGIFSWSSICTTGT